MYLYCHTWATFIAVLSSYPRRRWLTLTQSIVYYLYSLQLLRVPLGSSTHCLVLTDCKTYGYMVVCCHEIPEYLHTRHCRTLYTLVLYTVLNMTGLIVGGCTTKPHTEMLFSHILTLCRHSITVLPTTRRVVFMTRRCVNHFEYLMLGLQPYYEGYAYF